MWRLHTADVRVRPTQASVLRYPVVLNIGQVITDITLLHVHDPKKLYMDMVKNCGELSG